MTDLLALGAQHPHWNGQGYQEDQRRRVIGDVKSAREECIRLSLLGVYVDVESELEHEQMTDCWAGELQNISVSAARGGEKIDFCCVTRRQAIMIVYAF